MAGCSFTLDGTELVALDGGASTPPRRRRDRRSAARAVGEPPLAAALRDRGRPRRPRRRPAPRRRSRAADPRHDDRRAALDGRRRRAGRVRARFDYDTPELLLAFPFPHVLELDVSRRAGRAAVCETRDSRRRRAQPVGAGRRIGWHPDVLPAALRSLPTTGGSQLPDVHGIPTELDRAAGIADPRAPGDRTRGGTGPGSASVPADDLFALASPSSVAVPEGGAAPRGRRALRPLVLSVRAGLLAGGAPSSSRSSR